MAKIAKRRQRTQSDFMKPKYRPVAVALGQLTLIWNDLHEELATIYWTLEGFQCSAIQQWNAAKFDPYKRKLLKKRSRELLGLVPDVLERMLWLFKEIEVLAESRNDAAHSPLRFVDYAIFQNPGIIPNTTFGNPRAKNLSDKDILAEFRWYRDSAIILARFAHAMERALADEHSPLPDIPPWPIPQKKSSKGFRSLLPKDPLLKAAVRRAFLR